MALLPDLVARIRVDDSDLDRVSGKVGKFGADLDKTSDTSGRKVGGLTSMLGGLAGSLPVAGAAIGGVALAGLKLGGAFVETSSRLEALGAKSKTVFGEALPQVAAWADTNAAAMKLTRSEATGLATNMGDLLIPMGFTREAAAKMSTETVGLAGALSKWSGGQVTSADAAGILTDAMLGETDGLKALGISISAAEIDAALLAKGQDKLTGSARAQAEAQATQAIIFAKSTDAQAGYAAGQDTLSGKMETLRTKLREVWEQLVIKLTPAATAFADWITTKGIAALQGLGEWFGRNRQAILDMAAGMLSGVGTILRGLADLLSGASGVFRALIGGAATVAEALGLPIAEKLRATERSFQKTSETAVAGLRTAADAADYAAGKVRDLGNVNARPTVELEGVGRAALQNDKLIERLGVVGGQNPRPTVAVNGADAAVQAMQQLNTELGRADGRRVEATVRAAIQRDKAMGDGPGAPNNATGSVAQRIRGALNSTGAYITSGYRSPASNAAAGGSPRSYHLDAANPAMDIGGTTAQLDQVHAQLRSMGGWRELLWRVPNHYDHVHVAHKGGKVGADWYRSPGDGPDERTARLQVGETVVPVGGSGGSGAPVVNITFADGMGWLAGFVQAEVSGWADAQELAMSQGRVV